MDEASEQALVERAKKGETAAFSELVSRHGQFAYNLALTILNNPQEAEDIAQEAFVRAWQGLPRFRAASSFRTWLYRIVTNLCYGRLPRLRREMQALHEEKFEQLADKRPSAERELISGEWQQRLRQAIEWLPDNYRLLILLRHQQELSYQEIAEVTDMPLGTVKTILFRARRLLRQTLETVEEVSYEG